MSSAYVPLPSNHGVFVSKYLHSRVESTPNTIGEYRTYIKDEAALTCIDNDPLTKPNPKDGMLIFSANYADAGIDGQPNRWEIFVGFNKRVLFQYYVAPEKGGVVELAPYFTISAGPSFDLVGPLTAYNPVSGIVIVDLVYQSSATNHRYAANDFPPDGAAPNLLTSCYFDVLVF